MRVNRLQNHGLLLAKASILAAMMSANTYSAGGQATSVATSAAAACPQTLGDFERKHEEADRLFKAGNVSRGKQLYAEAYSLCPADYQNAHDLALAEFADGDSDDAKTLIALLLQNQDRAELHSLLGRIEVAEMKYPAAAVQYKAAAEMDPSEANVFDYGTVLFRLNYDAAIKILRFGTEKYPDSVRLHVALGTALYAQGLLEEGALMLCRAEELNPSDPHPMEILADTEIVPPSVQQRVIGLFEALQRRFPKDGLLLFDYTMVKSGRWSGEKDAIPANFVESLRAALALNPKLHQAYFQLGLVYGAQGKTADEIVFLRKAIALDSEKEQYHYHLATAYRKAGNQHAFEQEMDKFQEIHKKNPEAQNH
jgi:tetratricopeptide (TPR) repeat protein